MNNDHSTIAPSDLRPDLGTANDSHAEQQITTSERGRHIAG